MLTVQSFPWRRLTPSSLIEYRLDDSGALVLRGGATPPILIANVRDGRGGFVPRPIDSLPFFWVATEDDEGWIVRTRGEPTTMAHVNARYGDLARRFSEPLGLDERLVLTMIACEVGDAAPDADGFVKAPRTEPGYPRRTGERDPGDFDRDEEDWAMYMADPKHRITHSSHGVMQTLISTAVAARPDLFAGVADPAGYRTILWDPDDSIACGAARMASFPPDVLRDPLATRLRYAGGAVKGSTANAWGVTPLYDDLVPLLFLAFWNDDACLRAGVCKPSPLPESSQVASVPWLFAGCSLLALALVAAFGAAEKARERLAHALEVTR